MSGAFGGETTEYYARFRRGYPDAIGDAVVESLRLSSGGVIIDLGCVAPIPYHHCLACRVRVVVGVDPEADMLAAARRSTDDRLSSKMIWMLGSDADLLTLGDLLGDRAAGAITIGQALHFMDYEKVF